MKKLLFAIGYVIFLTLFLYLTIKTLIFSTMKDSFPNSQFIVAMLVFVIVLWTLGLFLKKSNIFRNSKALFVGSSASSLIIVMVIFWNF
ncbi:hypothetical protein ACMGD3_09530 [Lysinibacillus sphaericus]|uniref:hypothetical protein n=1 Tax=Lysinibacillus sphaericus TaxID=1421 RepID=UPI003F7AF8E4